MNKTLVTLTVLASFSLASISSAQSNIVYENSGDEGGGPVRTIQYIGSATENGTNIRIERSARADGLPVPAVPNVMARPLPPNPMRRTNREVIEFGRALQKGEDALFEQRMQNTVGTTAGQVRIDRAANGQPNANRLINIPQGIPGRPVFFRSSTTIGEAGNVQVVRTIAASGSRAIFLRDASSSNGTPVLNDRTFNAHFSAEGSTSPGNGTFQVSFEQQRPPINQFLNRVFDLFRRAAGENR